MNSHKLKALTVVALALFGAVSNAQPDEGVYRHAAAVTPAHRALEARVRELGRAFDGEVGIAVREIDGDWSTSWNGRRFFPQQSVSKFWVALTAFAEVDAGRLDLDQPVTIRREDLTLFHQPIAAQVGASGYTTTLGSLLFRALTQSDNTCNDSVLRTAGRKENKI